MHTVAAVAMSALPLTTAHAEAPMAKTQAPGWYRMKVGAFDGSVDVYGSGSGGPVRLRTMGPGSYFGEIGLLHGVARTATVVASGPCRLWRIPADAFLGAVGQAGVSGALTDGVRVRLRTSEQASG